MSQKSSRIKTYPIPLVRAAFAEPFLIAMRRNAIDAEPYLVHNGLPSGTLTEPNSLVQATIGRNTTHTLFGDLTDA